MTSTFSSPNPVWYYTYYRGKPIDPLSDAETASFLAVEAQKTTATAPPVAAVASTSKNTTPLPTLIKCAAKDDRDHLLTYEIVERRSTHRPKHGMRCQGNDYTRLQDVLYETRIVNTRVEILQLTRRARELENAHVSEIARKLAVELNRPPTSRRGVGVPRSPKCATKKIKRAKVIIEIPYVGTNMTPLCDVTVNNMTEMASLQVAELLVGTLFGEKPLFRGRCKRTKADLWELICEGVTFEQAALLKDLVCKLLYD